MSEVPLYDDHPPRSIANANAASGFGVECFRVRGCFRVRVMCFRFFSVLESGKRLQGR